MIWNYVFFLSCLLLGIILASLGHTVFTWEFWVIETLVILIMIGAQEAEL